MLRACPIEGTSRRFAPHATPEIRIERRLATTSTRNIVYASLWSFARSLFGLHGWVPEPLTRPSPPHADAGQRQSQQAFCNILGAHSLNLDTEHVAA